MQKDEEQTLINVLNGLSNKIDNNKTSKLMDMGMKVAATVSTAGILAVFALFFTTIPSLKQSIEHVSWETSAMKAQLSKLGDEPRFTLKDYNLEEREQRADISRMKAQIEVWGEWMIGQNQINLDQNYRLDTLEKDMHEPRQPKKGS